MKTEYVVFELVAKRIGTKEYDDYYYILDWVASFKDKQSAIEWLDEMAEDNDRFVIHEVFREKNKTRETNENC